MFNSSAEKGDAVAKGTDATRQGAETTAPAKGADPPAAKATVKPTARDSDAAEITEASSAVAKNTSQAKPDEDQEAVSEADAIAQQLAENAVVSQLDPEDHKAQVQVMQRDPNSPLFSAKSFEELNLHKELLDGVYGMKFAKPSRIQEAALPLILRNPPENLIAQAANGSGKTACFVLGMLSRVDTTVNSPQALCICPTRELAKQIAQVVRDMSKYSSITNLCLVKDVLIPKSQKIQEHVIIGTPGRVMGAIKARQFETKRIRVFVLDEADVMMDMQGMADQTLRLKKLVPKTCQTLLFSATYRDDVKRFAERNVEHPNKIFVKKERLSLDTIKQYFVELDSEAKKFEMLSDMYGALSGGQSIIFVEDVTERMRAEGHTVTVLYGGDMSSEVRDKTMDEFRHGTTKVLITTNVLARGIDVPQVSLVVNYDLPVNNETGDPDYETYLHRIARTGRFGRKGVAVNFVHDSRSKKILGQIEGYYEREIKPLPADDIEALESALSSAW